MVKRVIAPENLGNTFAFDETNKKIDVNTGTTLAVNSTTGAIDVKLDATAAQLIAFIEEYSDADVNLSTEVAANGDRLLHVTKEGAITNTINLSTFLVDLVLDDVEFINQVLTFKDNTGATRATVDLSTFLRAADVSGIAGINVSESNGQIIINAVADPSNNKLFITPAGLKVNPADVAVEDAFGTVLFYAESNGVPLSAPTPPPGS